MVRSLSSKEFLGEVKPAYDKIFADDNPFSPHPFASSIESRKILFDWDYKYVVAPPLLNAIVTAAVAVGDSGLYIFGNMPADTDKSVYLPFSEIELYASRREPLEAITAFEQNLISPQGVWGIKTSHETHMLLGSTKQFFEELKTLLPDIDEQANVFLEHWQEIKANDGTSTDGWLPGLMQQVYGADEAAEKLKSFGLP
ncbi:MAG: hypothetical protein F6K31_33055 [Symploca sp. SIO2G7]|nr:hypothetical protein [Symploca sp. SIO2G7]